MLVSYHYLKLILEHNAPDISTDYSDDPGEETYRLHWTETCCHHRWLAFRYYLWYHLVLKNITTLDWLIFIDHNLFEDDISVIFDKFSSIKCLSITKNLVNAKRSVVGKLLPDGKPLVVSKNLADTNLVSVGKHLVDTKHSASMKMLTDLTYLIHLLDLTIYENSNISRESKLRAYCSPKRWHGQWLDCSVIDGYQQHFAINNNNLIRVWKFQKPWRIKLSSFFRRRGKNWTADWNERE